MKVISVLLTLAVLLTSCTNVETQRNRHADLSAFKRFFVEHRLNDDHHLDEYIVDELHALGREASAGPLTMMPPDADAIVTYQDAWAWDFKTYLIQLTIDFRQARTDKPLARGTYRQPSVITKQPPDVVRAILVPLFKRR